MTTTPALRLSLELHSDGERISGRLRDQRGNDWPFANWLGLLSVIERLRTSTSSAQSNDPETTDRGCPPRPPATAQREEP